MRRNGNLLGKRIWMLLLPCILNSIAIQTGNVVDTMLIGNILGENALAAMQLLMPVLLISQLPGMIMGTGGVITIGNLMGKRKLDEANKTITTVVLLNALISALIVTLLLAFQEPLLRTLAGARGAGFINDARGYLRWFCLSIPLINIVYPIVLLFMIDNHASLASIYMILSNVINLVCDYLLMRYTNMGTGAAALSSFIGYVSCLWVFVVYYRSKTRILKADYRFGSIRDIKERLGTVLKNGEPTLATNALQIVRNLGLNTIIISFAGATSMVAFTLCSNVIMMTSLFVGGIEQIIPNIVGVLFGEKDYFGIKYVMRMLAKIAAVFLGAFMIFVLIFPGLIGALYGISGGESYALSVTALRIFVFSLPFLVLNEFMGSYFQATNRPRLSTLTIALQNMIIVLPLALLLAWLVGFQGVILALVLSELLSAVIVRLIVSKRFPGQNFLLLPDKQDVPNMETSVTRDEESLMRISDTLTFFGELHGLSSKESYYMALAVEEMAMNTLRFPDNKNVDLHIDISSTILEDEVLIRLRDDGAPLDAWAKDPEKESETPPNANEPVTDPVETVRRIASGTSYIRMLNMNNTIVALKRAAEKGEKL